MFLNPESRIHRSQQPTGFPIRKMCRKMSAINAVQNQCCHESRAKCRLSRQKAGWAFKPRLLTTGPVWANRSGKSRPDEKKPSWHEKNGPAKQSRPGLGKGGSARSNKPVANIARSAFPFIQMRLICRRSCYTRSVLCSVWCLVSFLEYRTFEFS